MRSIGVMGLAAGLALAGCGGSSTPDVPPPCDPVALDLYWTPSPNPPQAGFQVPGLAAAGFPAQLDCAQAQVATVQVRVGAPPQLVPCTGDAATCLDADTWLCGVGGVSVPLPAAGTYPVQVDGFDRFGTPKYAGAASVAVAACGRTGAGLFPQGLPGTLGLDYQLLAPPSPFCEPGSAIEWDLVAGTPPGGTLVEAGATACGGPNPFLLAGGAVLPAGLYTLTRVAEVLPGLPPPIHSLCSSQPFVHAGEEIVLVDLPAYDGTCP